MKILPRSPENTTTLLSFGKVRHFHSNSYTKLIKINANSFVTEFCSVFVWLCARSSKKYSGLRLLCALVRYPFGHSYLDRQPTVYLWKFIISRHLPCLLGLLLTFCPYFDKDRRALIKIRLGKEGKARETFRVVGISARICLRWYEEAYFFTAS